MEPLTAQQEPLLVYDDQNVQSDEEEKIKHNTVDPESETGIDSDSPSYSEKNISVDNTIPSLIQNDDYASIGTDAPQSPRQEKSQDQSGADDTLVASNRESEIVNALVASGSTDSYSSLGSDVIDSTHVPKESMGNDNRTQESLKDHMADQKVDELLKHESLNSSYRSGNIDNVASNYVETTLEAQLVSENEISETTTLLGEIHEQGRMPEVSVEGISSALELHKPGETHSFGTISMSAPDYAFADEQVKNVNSDITMNHSISESPNSSHLFSSIGIPAPSAVFEALRGTPGKILVQPAFDQVQGQAFAALQAMKVFVCTNHDYIPVVEWLEKTCSSFLRKSCSFNFLPVHYGIRNIKAYTPV